MRPFFVFVLVLLISIAHCADSSSNSERCPKVYDGLTNGHFDLSTQFSTSSLSANWDGLTSDEVLSYDCSVVSEAILRDSQLPSGCRRTQGFFGIPDIRNWLNVRKENSVTINNLKLTPGVTYYVVVRTTLTNGVQLFSNSNGIVVLPQELKLEGSHVKSKTRDVPQQKAQPRIPGSCYASECPIDEANRCRAAKVSVQDFLNQFYGPPRFADNLEFFLFGFALPLAVTEDDDDDDDGYSHAENDGIIAGVIAGVLLLMLLCLLLLALLALFMAPKGGDQPFGERIVERKQEHVDADLGTSVEHQIAGADTRVEFPDIDPHSRLSQA
jgi:hypothetical protein